MKLYKSGAILVQEMVDTTVSEGMVAIWALGQEGFVIRAGGRTLGIDLYLTDSIGRAPGSPWVRKFAPPLTPEELPPLDVVLCTHHHEDHMDAETLRPLQSREHTRFVIPRAHEARLKGWGFRQEQLVGINHQETQGVHGIEIKALAAMHDRFEQDAAGNHLYLGYLIKVGGLTIYHAGDTIGFPELVDWLREQPIDIAMIPMNGRDYARTAQGIVGNCNYREAADLGVTSGADLIIPMHFGMFPHNDENPAFFTDYMYKQYPERKYHMMTPGERFVYLK